MIITKKVPRNTHPLLLKEVELREEFDMDRLLSSICDVEKTSINNIRYELMLLKGVISKNVNCSGCEMTLDDLKKLVVFCLNSIDCCDMAKRYEEVYLGRK